MEDIPGSDEGERGGQNRYGDVLEDILGGDKRQNVRILNSENKKERIDGRNAYLVERVAQAKFRVHVDVPKLRLWCVVAWT